MSTTPNRPQFISKKTVTPPLFIKAAKAQGFNIDINELWQDDDLDIRKKAPYRKPFILLSPDGLPLQREPVTFTNFRDAEKAFIEWRKQFKEQGYYSPPKHGRIPLEDIVQYIDWEEIGYLPSDSEQTLPLVF